MHLKRSLFLFVFLVLSFYPTNLKAQKYISATGGLSVGSLFDFNKDHWVISKYDYSNAYFTNVYLGGLGSVEKIGIGLQFGKQDIFSEIIKGSHYSHSAWIHDAKLQYFQFNFDYLFTLKSTRRFKINFFLGSAISCNSRTVLNSVREYSTANTVIDSLGQSHISVHIFSEDFPEEISTKLIGVNIGLNAGYSIGFALIDRVDLVFENKYNLFFYQKTNFDHVEFPLLLRGDFSLGVRFRL